MRMLRAALLTCLALVLGGCGTMGGWLGGGDEPELAELEPVADAIPVRTLWRREVGEGAGGLHIQLAPAVAGERVYGAGVDGRVSALDAGSGAELWVTDLGQPLSGGPGVGEGLVLVGTREGEVFALDAASGAQLWRAPVTSEVLAAPAAASGTVVVRTIDGRLFGLAVRDGERRWIYDSPVPVLSLRGTGEPVIAGDLVLSGFDGGRLVALALGDGRLEWERRVAVPRGRSELERMVDIDSRPVVVDDTVYVASYQGRVAALDLVTGKRLWERDISSHAGLAVDDAAVYVTDAEDLVWAFDRFTGNSLWRQTALKGRAVTVPARVDGYVAVADFEGLVHWLRTEDGGFAARTPTGGARISSPPAAAKDGTLFVYDNRGRLTALQAP